MATDQVDASGLVLETLPEIKTNLETGLKTIYGPDIVVASNSPDGQIIGIFAQAAIDLRELLLQVYNSFSVPAAFGVLLDQRVALNGLARKAGTYTVAQVLITVDQALTLPGLDQAIVTPFTVKDENGNQFQLVTSYVFGGAGSATLAFKAQNIGAILTAPNTITNQSTTTLGVTAVNNPSTTSDVIGVNEESDQALKIRHGQSFYLAADGPAKAIAAALLSIPAVQDAFVIENSTTGTVNGTPAHSIWCIVTGGAAVDIAQAIYSKKNLGCGLRGAITQGVSRPNSGTFTAKWDVSISQPLHISFGLTARVAGATFDIPTLKTQLAAALAYKLGQSPNIGDVVNAMLTLAPDGYLTAIGVSSDGMTYVDSISPTDSQYYFTLSSANITIT